MAYPRCVNTNENFAILQLWYFGPVQSYDVWRGEIDEPAQLS